MLTGTPNMYGTPFPTQGNQAFGGYDPLAVGYMSQGQMGYMPQQQYLTPSGYGAFRTLPSNVGYGQVYQRNSMFQNMVYANDGRFLGLPLPTYNPSVDMVTRRGMSQMGLADNAVAYGGTLLDTAVSAAMFLNPYTAAASFFMPNIGGYAADVQGQTRNIQRMTTPRINFGPDVNRLTGMGFSTGKAMGIEQFIRKSAASDPFLKQEDYREIMRHGIENNLFDYSNTASSYKKIIERLRKQTDVVLEVIDDKNIEGVMKNLKRLQDMGATGDQATSIIRHENMFSRMTGMRHTDMINAYGQQGALIYAQHGLTGYQGSLSAMGSAASLAAAQKLGLIDPGTLNRMGGVSGYVQTETNEMAAANKEFAKMILPFVATKNFTEISTERLKDLVNGKIGVMDAVTMGAREVSNPTAHTQFRSNEAQLMEKLFNKLGPVMDKLLLYLSAQEYGSKYMGIEDKEQAAIAGFINLHKFSPELAVSTAKKYSDPVFISTLRDAQLRELQAANEKELSKQAHAGVMTPFTSIKEKLYSELGAPIINFLTRFNELSEAGKKGTGVITPWNFTGYTHGVYSPLNRYGGSIPGVVDDSGLTTDSPPDDLFNLSKKYESTSMYSIGYDASGRNSYGSFQLASGPGTLQWYLRERMKKGSPSEAAAAKHMLSLNLREGSEGPEAWKKYIAAGEFSEDTQKEFLYRTHYQVVLNTIKKKNPELYEMIASDFQLQRAMFSTAVQHGPTGGARAALRAHAPGMSMEAFVDALFPIRHSMVGSDAKSATADRLLNREYREVRDGLGKGPYAPNAGIRDKSPIHGSGLLNEYSELHGKFTEGVPPFFMDSDLNDLPLHTLFAKRFVGSSRISSESNEALLKSKLKMSPLQFSVKTKGIFEDFKYKDDYDFRRKIQDWLMANNFPLGDAITMSHDPEVEKLFLKALSEQRPDLLAIEKSNLSKLYNKQSEVYGKNITKYSFEIRDQIQATLGIASDSEATDYMELMRSTGGNAFDVAALELDIRQSVADGTLDANKESFTSKLKSIGITDKNTIEKIFNEGGVYKHLGYSDSDNALIQKIIDGRDINRVTSIQLRDLTLKMVAADMRDKKFALDRGVTDKNFSIEDLMSVEGIKKILETEDLDEGIRKTLSAVVNDPKFSKAGPTEKDYMLAKSAAAHMSTSYSINPETAPKKDDDITILGNLVDTNTKVAENLKISAEALAVIAGTNKKNGNANANKSPYIDSNGMGDVGSA